MIFGINTTRDISKFVSNFSRLKAREITYNNFEISLVVFMPDITTNHADRRFKNLTDRRLNQSSTVDEAGPT